MEHQQSTPIQTRKPTTTSQIDALLEKKDLSLSSSINSGYSTPTVAVGVQPTPSSTQIGRNGKKIPLMSPDNFMRAIGLFRPLPSNATETKRTIHFFGCWIWGSKNGSRRTTEAVFSSSTRKTSFSTSYQALLGSPVLDEDEQKATVNRNEAAERSNSGYTNTPVPPRPQPRSPVRPPPSSASSGDKDEEDDCMGVRKKGGCEDCGLSEEYESMPLIIDAPYFQRKPRESSEAQGNL